MNKYIIIDGKLYRHSDIRYIDLSEGEMMHWKYLRRVKLPNGKYRYYYEKDNNKLNIGRTQKYSPTFNFYGAKATPYLIKSRETGNNWMVVDKSLYNRTRRGYKLYVGNTRLSSIAAEQIQTGMRFVSDLLHGRVQR